VAKSIKLNLQKNKAARWGGFINFSLGLGCELTSDFLGSQRVSTWHFHIPGKSNLFHAPDDNPAQIKLPPFQAVACR
jgi:hypothetical protein